MRCFKTTKYSHLAQFLLEFTEGEQRMKLKRTMINGYVKQSVLEQYFSDAELRKKYPKTEIEHVLDVLVKAGLLEECKHGET